ncbi:DNA-binding transcriptional MerR regulator [Kitasatospora sp. GP30]|uniref:helix-turn-helix domain-containing protein n=1 Tax=Kitasatospora sp. GP30 TaxID=3035084 RepID=UPI000CAEA69E|nr:MerR family DNA-binding transcriptional regulator [Kitasatospora sp. GP30]MDH6139450.1 DNA-binding transcriptional MerR regulator [Kitasatospora sp. GP30]
MTVGTPPGGETSLSIGMLAEAAGVSVKTVRYYSDQGLLPAAQRSAGGHRRYGTPALARLRQLRGLRALGLSLPTAGEVAAGELALDRALAQERAELARQLTELRWREAALAALADHPEELLTLGEALREAPRMDVFAAFWRRVLPVRLPTGLKRAIVDAVLPELPAEPTPQQALAYARLHALSSDRELAAAARTPAAKDTPSLSLTYEGTSEAYRLALAELARGAEPGPGEALDAYVAAFARGAGRVDDAAFRRELAAFELTHPVIARYWHLARALHPGPTMGDAHEWINSALRLPG